MNRSRSSLFWHFVIFLGLTLSCSRPNSQPASPSSQDQIEDGIIDPVSPSPHSTAPGVGVAQTDGGVDGGGGNYVASEESQIRAIFKGDGGFNLKETIKSAFETMAMRIKSGGEDPEVESIFSRMLGPDFSGADFDIFQDIDGTKYELKQEGACLESVPGASKDASTEMNKKTSPICFSLERLMRLPIQALPFQIVALAVHEHSHHYGFSEKDAIIAQKEILRVLNETSVRTLFIDTIDSSGDIRDNAGQILRLIKEKGPVRIICQHLGYISKDSQKLIGVIADTKHRFEDRSLITALDLPFGVSAEGSQDAIQLEALSKETLKFCEKRYRSEPPSKSEMEKSLVDLTLRVKKIFDLSQKFLTQTSDFADQRKKKSRVSDGESHE